MLKYFLEVAIMNATTCETVNPIIKAPSNDVNAHGYPQANVMGMYQRVNQAGQYNPYQVQSDFIQKEIAKARVRVEEHMAKVDYSTKAKKELSEHSQMLREMAEERKRAQYDVVDWDRESGSVYEKRVNLAVPALHRTFSNMAWPEVIMYQSVRPEDARCILLRCVVAQKTLNVYLSERRIYKGNYLVEKLRAGGIYFNGKAESEIKRCMHRFIAILQEECEDVITLPDKCGWYRDSEGNYTFFEEEDLVWEKILLLMK